MKKLLALVAALAFSAAALTGCGGSAAEPGDSGKAPESDVWSTFKADFSIDQTCEMSSFMRQGMYLIEGDTMYGLCHSESEQGALAVRDITMVGDFPEFGEPLILDDRGCATYICKDGEYLYYLMNYMEVCRIKVDGTGRETLYEGPCDYLQIHDGALYFTDADFKFVTMPFTGGTPAAVIDRAVFYPYFISGDWLVFQDDADDETLHLANISSDVDVRLTNAISYQPILDGSYLYYVNAGEADSYLCRIDMSDPSAFAEEASTTPLNGDFIIGVDYIISDKNHAVDREDWKDLGAVSGDAGRYEMYVSSEYSVQHDYDAEGYVTAKYLTSQKTSGGTSFA